MRRALILSLVAASALQAQANAVIPIQEFNVPWGREGRPRDAAVSPVDGAIFFVGQSGDEPVGNYVARLDPKTGAFKKFQLEKGAQPHSCLVDSHGNVWYTGNANGTLGRIDVKTGVVRTWTVGEGIRDPHTMVFDKNGNIWFTAQNTNGVGFFDLKTEKFRIVKPPIPEGKTYRSTRPYGIVLDSKGHPWFNLFSGNQIGTIHPETFELKTFNVGNDSTTNRRIAITSDDKIYYTDYRRGRLGYLDPATGKTEDWLLPGGGASLPYGMIIDDQNRVWVAEAQNQNGKLNQLVGFDPKTKKFFHTSPIPGDRNTVRHMFFDKKTKQIWWAMDSGQVLKLDVSGVKITM